MSARSPTKALNIPKPEWWTHLRYNKRTFWKRSRQKAKQHDVDNP